MTENTSSNALSNARKREREETPNGAAKIQKSMKAVQLVDSTPNRSPSKNPRLPSSTPGTNSFMPDGAPPSLPVPGTPLTQYATISREPLFLPGPSQHSGVRQSMPPPDVVPIHVVSEPCEPLFFPGSSQLSACDEEILHSRAYISDQIISLVAFSNTGWMTWNSLRPPCSCSNILTYAII